jgi:hypothetical protein
LPVLQEIDQRLLVVELKELGVDDVQLVANQVVEGHARVLCSALDEPVERETFLNLKLPVSHTIYAFGGGVGRVSGQSGLKGSGSRFGCDGGATRSRGVGSGCAGFVGGASGSVWGIAISLIGAPVLPSKEYWRHPIGKYY